LVCSTQHCLCASCLRDLTIYLPHRGGCQAVWGAGCGSHSSSGSPCIIVIIEAAAAAADSSQARNISRYGSWRRRRRRWRKGEVYLREGLLAIIYRLGLVMHTSTSLARHLDFILDWPASAWQRLSKCSHCSSPRESQR
jgi:hypothetical protein